MSKFTAGELEVMRVLWEHGELKPAQIISLFSREIKNPALRAVLAVLVEKGHVTRRHVGKAFFYQAVTRRESALRSMLGELVEHFFDGSTKTLIFNLVKSEKLSVADIAELERLANLTSNPSKPKATLKQPHPREKK